MPSVVMIAEALSARLASKLDSWCGLLRGVKLSVKWRWITLHASQLLHQQAATTFRLVTFVGLGVLAQSVRAADLPPGLQVLGAGSLWERPVLPVTLGQGWVDTQEPLHQIRATSRVSGELPLPKGTIQVHAAVRLTALAPRLVARLESPDPKVGWERNPIVLPKAGEPIRVWSFREISESESDLFSIIKLHSGGIPIYPSGRGYEEQRYLPAIYEKKFELSCYGVANERDPLHSKGVPTKVMLDKKLTRINSRFLVDAARQGTGMRADGTYIQRIGPKGKRVWVTRHCPLTRHGICAVDGVTVASDPTVVPHGATISIHPTDALRHVIDTGGDIKGHHLDLFYGARMDECRAFGRRFDGRVKLIHRGLLKI